MDANHPKTNAKLRDERLAMMRSDRAIDLALLEESLEQPHAWGMGDTYSRWRWPKVLYLYEAFLGTDPVARATVSYAVSAAANVKRWGPAGDDPKRRNTVHHYVAAALPWLLLRASPKVAAALRKELAGVPASKKVPTYVDILHWIGGPVGTPPPTGFETLDGQGRVRASDEGNASCTLDGRGTAMGQPFTGAREFVTAQADAITRCAVTNLLRFAYRDRFVPDERVAQFHEAFRGSNHDFHQLMRAVALDPRFRLRVAEQGGQP